LEEQSLVSKTSLLKQGFVEGKESIQHPKPKIKTILTLLKKDKQKRERRGSFFESYF
jgi:uncharacterized protein (UPF0335 family)